MSSSQRPRSISRAVRAAACLVLLLSPSLLHARATAATGPAIEGFGPSSGPVGATISVTGTGLAGATAARVGGAGADFFVVDDGRVDVVVPYGPSRGKIELDTPEGTASSAEPFVVLPNIVVVLTDDQRWDTLANMQGVQSHLVDRGVTFANAFASTPVCCPSRATLLTGRYAHGTGVWSNDSPYGGFPAFDDSTTVATVLDAAGYRTAWVGKYLNGYTETGGTYVPPGWDTWRAMASGGGYYNYEIALDGGATEAHGDRERDYSTDVLAGHARSIARGTSPQEALFLVLAVVAPHSRFIPAPRHEGTLSGMEPWRPPSYDEADVFDKPYYIRKKPRLSTEEQQRLDALRQGQLETLLAVDEAVGGLLRTLRNQGRLQDTLLIFTSDNGYLWGEHRTSAKDVPYEESIRVPLVVRWDRLEQAARVESALVQNIDLAPSLAKAAGATMPEADGRNLIPLLRDPALAWRGHMLFEHYGTAVPSYCAIRTGSAKFVHYTTGEEEYYRLAADPYELSNRVTAPQFQTSVTSLRDVARAMCDPLPPEMPPF